MKLHLPKNLFLIALAMTMTQPLLADGETGTDITTEYNPDEEIMPVANLGTGNIESNGTYTYLNVGKIAKLQYTSTWKGDLYVGDSQDNEGTVDKVGYFDANGNLLTPDGKTNVTKNLEVTGTLTVQGNGQIVLGGQYDPLIGDDSYRGLDVNSLVVTGGSVTSTKIIANSINISGGTVSTHTGNCSSGNNYYEGCGPKQSYIKDSISIKGGSLTFGYTSKVQGIGTDTHRMTVLGSSSDFKITQSGGTLKVVGDADLQGGSTITQDTAAGTMIFRDGLHIRGGGTTTIEQKVISTDEDAKAILVFGLLTDSGTKPKSGTVFDVQQSGNGFIHFAYGSSFSQSSTINVTQTGGGTVKIGGGHEDFITKELPNNWTYALSGRFESLNTTYNFDQEENGGTIILASGADITASDVKLNSQNGTFIVEKGAKLSADSITIDGGTLINGSAEDVATLSLANELTPLEDTQDLLTTIAAGSITVKSGEYQNFGTTNADILVEGGQLTLENGSSVGNIEMKDGGNIDIIGSSKTGTLTLNGGTLTFSEGAVLNSTQITLSENVAIIVNVDASIMDALQNGEGSVKLFSCNVEQLEGAEVTFVAEGHEDVKATVSQENGSVTITAVVPEPTTATLSLLALAALAARRRRK